MRFGVEEKLARSQSVRDSVLEKEIDHLVRGFRTTGDLLGLLRSVSGASASLALTGTVNSDRYREILLREASSLEITKPWGMVVDRKLGSEGEHCSSCSRFLRNVYQFPLADHWMCAECFMDMIVEEGWVVDIPDQKFRRVRSKECAGTGA